MTPCFMGGAMLTPNVWRRLRTAAELAEKSPSSLDGIPVLQQARIHRYGGLAVQLLCKELRAYVGISMPLCLRRALMGVVCVVPWRR